MTLFISRTSSPRRAVVDVEHADGLLAARVLLDHEKSGDLELVEQCERFVDQIVRPDRLWIPGHELAGTMVEAAFDIAAKVAVGDHSDEIASGIGNADNA